MTIEMKAAMYAAERAFGQFGGRKGDGKKPRAVGFRQMKQRDLTILLKAAYLAGVQAAKLEALERPADVRATRGSE